MKQPLHFFFSASALPLVVSLLVICGGSHALAQTPAARGAESAVEDGIIVQLSASTNAVLDRNMRAFAARDVDALLENYTDQSVLVVQEAVYQGRDQIRVFFERLITEFASPKTTMTMLQRHVHGPIAFIDWTAQTPAHHYELGTDTFYITNGRILYQTFAFKAQAQTPVFTLSSPDITAGSTISSKHILNGFGCTGQNVSPALAWRNVPAGTKSLALLVFDPDAPTGSGLLALGRL